MTITRIILAFLAAALPCAAQRPAINGKRAPEHLGDLREIQNEVMAALPAARAATVCIQLGEQGSGSGVVVSRDGLIMTAAHVTGGVGKEFTVIFEDGRELKAESLGLNSETDCALAKITEPGSYPFVEIDRDDSAKLGDWVFALGHSGGFDKDRGVVSRIGRIVRTRKDTLQSDCDLIGGDSGGPLFDLGGKVIGIHSRVGSRIPENMHVPAREFLRQWDQLEESEFVGEGPFAKRPDAGKAFLGILVEEREEGGVVVKRVGRESPAEKAGLKAGDVVLRFDDAELSSRDALHDLLDKKAPDDRVTMVLLRDGKEEMLTIKLGNRDE
jgi:serine protease Do